MSPKNTLRWIAGLALLVVVSTVSADVSSLSGAPASNTVTLGSNNTVNLTWTMVSDANPPVTFTSNQGVFRHPTSGNPIGAPVATMLTGIPTTPPDTAIVNEALTVPAGVISDAYNQGLASFIYERSFTDGLAGMTATVLMTIQVPPSPGPTVAVQNSTPTVTIGSAGNANVVWTTTNNFASSATIQSSQLILRTPQGQVLNTINRVLSQTVASGGNAIFSENVSISAGVIQSALEQGAGQIVMERVFSDGSASNTANTQVRVVGSGSGGLEVLLVSLRFQDQRVFSVVEEGASLGAVAELTYSGTGLLEGAWEIARPPSTAGEPVYQNLALVRQALPVGGRTTLRSPDLPTDTGGFYLLRFTVQNDDSQVQPVVIRYRVSAVAQAVKRIDLLSPAAHSLVGEGSVFRWENAPGAVAYRLEIYEVDAAGNLPSLGNDGDSPPPDSNAAPVTGVLLPENQDSTVLSILVRSHLRPGTDYRWRVVGLNADGDALASSGYRRFRVP